MRAFYVILLLSLCACRTPTTQLQANLPALTFENPAWQPHSSYMAHVMSSVQKKWERLLLEARVYPGSGKDVAVRFRLGAQKGEVLEILEVDGTANAIGKRCCVLAVTSAAPFGAWTPEMRNDLGEDQELTFRFFYQ